MADKKHNRIRKDSVMIAFDVIKYILLTITALYGGGGQRHASWPCDIIKSLL